jgi:DnaJ domain
MSVTKPIHNKMIPSSKGSVKTGVCLACGTDGIKPGRRYCSKTCRQQILWVLSLSNGLLRVFNARYAAFSFNKSYVILDVLPIWSKEISRFVHKRGAGRKPAEDLKHLILKSGNEWYHAINNKSSKSYASLCLLKKNNNHQISPTSIKPEKKVRPRLSKIERASLKLLKIKIDELFCDEQIPKIKSAYKRLAKIHHPDVGGDAEKFKKLNEAHQQMLGWAENPQFTAKRALVDCWSYDGTTNKWSPPL